MIIDCTVFKRLLNALDDRVRYTHLILSRGIEIHGFNLISPTYSTILNNNFLITSVQIYFSRWKEKTDKKENNVIDTHVRNILVQYYNKTFMPIVKFAIFKYLLMVATMKNWEPYQFDINNIFLNENLEENVYMNLP